MSEDQILITERDSILELVFNRPAKLNAMSGEMLRIMKEQTEHFASTRNLRVMLLRANGRYFSAGIDLASELAPDPEIDSPAEFRRWYREGRGSLHPLGDRWEAIEKPIVVAHHATCLGGALELSLSCDFRLAGSSARYGLPETALGCLPASGGVSRLTRLIGPQWARWFIMANLQMDAQQAASVGLVHAVYPDKELVDRAWDFCRNLAAQPPETVAAAKIAIELTADLERAQARQVERLANSGLVFGEEFAEFVAMRARVSSPKS